ncbi:hypothetical protein TB2_045936 [Malus domestica]
MEKEVHTEEEDGAEFMRGRKAPSSKGSNRTPREVVRKATKRGGFYFTTHDTWAWLVTRYGETYMQLGRHVSSMSSMLPPSLSVAPKFFLQVLGALVECGVLAVKDGQFSFTGCRKAAIAQKELSNQVVGICSRFSFLIEAIVFTTTQDSFIILGQYKFLSKAFLGLVYRINLDWTVPIELDKSLARCLVGLNAFRIRSRIFDRSQKQERERERLTSLDAENGHFLKFNPTLVGQFDTKAHSQSRLRLNKTSPDRCLRGPKCTSNWNMNLKPNLRIYSQRKFVNISSYPG